MSGKKGLTSIELLITLLIVGLLCYFFLKIYVQGPLFPKKAGVSADGKSVEDTDVIHFSQDKVKEYNEKVSQTNETYKQLE